MRLLNKRCEDTTNSKLYDKLKKLSKSSMECSFCIWLARNYKESTPATNLKIKGPLKETCSSPSPMLYLKQNIKPVSKANSVCPVGYLVINKGNTYHVNSILEFFSVMCLLRNRVPSESNNLLLMLRAISLKMAVKKITPNLLIHQTFYRP